MLKTKKPLAKLNIKGLFLVWAYPQGSHRSQLMAETLGMPVEHVYFMRRQGYLAALLKYPVQALKTPLILLRHQPDVVFVQNPPIFGALIVYLWGLMTGTKLIIDSHTDALLASWWEWTFPFHKFLSQRSITTLVTNEHLRQIVTDWDAPAFILVDPPSTYPERTSVTLPAGFNVVLVSTASYDEPINEVLEAARNLPEVQFHITGNFDRAPHHQGVRDRAPSNVRFTGYVPDNEFYGVLAGANLVMSLTTENHTIQSGASEALWLGRPVITSDWPVLRNYFNRGAVLVDNTAGSIQQAVETIRDNQTQFQADILALQEERQQEWWQRANALIGLILQSGVK
jgi:glycosyltransferase involved in cell wall biosynthesis